MDSRFGNGCAHCGAGFDFALNRVVHAANCPYTPGHVAGLVPVANLDAARFNRAEKPTDLTPRTALIAALEWVAEQEAAGVPIAHLIVLTGGDGPDHPGASRTRFFQAGTYRHHAQMGLCVEGMHMMRDSGSD